MSYFYGVRDEEHLVNTTRRVVHVFGGGLNAMRLCLGTIATETDFAQFADRHPEKLGVGVAQCDRIRLIDTKQHIRAHDKKALLNLGYDIDTIKLSDLAYDPVLAISIMRIAYKRIPAAIPETLEGIAHYWKDHYNSHHPNAKGTPEKFIEDWFNFVPQRFHFD